jgi:hypothetical protein
MHVNLPDPVVAVPEVKYFFCCLIIKLLSSGPLFLSSEGELLSSSMVTSQKCVAGSLRMPCGSPIPKGNTMGQLHRKKLNLFWS